MIIYNKRYRHIIQFFNNTLNLIIKLPKNEDELDYIYHEYYIYSLIDHPSFNAYYTLFQYENISYNDKIIFYNEEIDMNKIFSSSYNILFKNNKFNMLIGNYDENMVTLYTYCISCKDIDKIINIYKNVLIILDDCFIKWNFVHGDFKSNNILVNIKSPEDNIKFIDFEFSVIFKNYCINVIMEMPLMNLYLKLDEESIITKEFGRLFDIYALCVDFIRNNIIDLYLFKEKMYLLIKNNIDDIHESFIDFYIIFENIYLIKKEDLFNIKLNCLNLSFLSIIKNLSCLYTSDIETYDIEESENVFNTLNILDKIKDRKKHISNVLNKMGELNLLCI